MDAMSAMHTTAGRLVPLAQELDENKVTPGVLGFLVFAVLGAAVWALMKSMNRHMGRVDFAETGPAEQAAAPSAESGTGGKEAGASA